MKIKPVEQVLEFLKDVCKDIDVKIVEVEFKQGKNPAMTVFIDKVGGVDLDTCEKVHNLINDPLDQLDPTYGEPYTLNVSSLGADRPFKSDEDFLSHIDKKVEVYLKNSVKGKKAFDGILTKYDGNSIVIKVDSKQSYSFELKSVIKVNEYIDF